MIVKTLEIRDTGTFIPALAIQLDPRDGKDLFLLARAGFGASPEQQREYVVLIHLQRMQVQYDPHSWPNRTMVVAHMHISEEFEKLPNGAVVDVEFITGDATTPKLSEFPGATH